MLLEDWQIAAERLFGPDYIIPLSAALRINRRTVERWRSGAVQIPEPVRHSLVSLVERGCASPVYGGVLRIMSAGHSITEIQTAVRQVTQDIEDPGSVARRLAEAIDE